jgi:hypothetical protein
MTENDKPLPLANDPLRPITMQDIRLIAGEGTLSARTVLEAVNVILRQRAGNGEQPADKASLEK